MLHSTQRKLLALAVVGLLVSGCAFLTHSQSAIAQQYKVAQLTNQVLSSVQSLQQDEITWHGQALVSDALHIQIQQALKTFATNAQIQLNIAADISKSSTDRQQALTLVLTDLTQTTNQILVLVKASPTLVTNFKVGLAIITSAVQALTAAS